ncbi:MAG: ZIP family metal transporter [Bacteroidales bacterium]
MELRLFTPALLMTIIEGCALLLGLFLTLYKKQHNRSTLSYVFSFSGGMMLFAAFVKFLPSSISIFETQYDYRYALIFASISFFFGLLITAPLDILITRKQRSVGGNSKISQSKQEYHIYILLLSSLIFHNFLEGIATYISFLEGKSIALVVVISLVAHNIPEGALISLIVYKRTKSRLKAIKYSVLTALTGPLGAVVTAIIIPSELSLEYLGVVKALLAGILVNTALSELILPNACAYDKQNISKKGIIIGMLFMSLLLIIS